MAISKVEQRLKENIEFFEINYWLLNKEDYFFKIINELHDDFFQHSYTSNDKEFNEKKRKNNKTLISNILEEKYEEHLKKYKKYLPRENNLDEAISYILSILINHTDYSNKEVILKDIYETMETNYPTELIVNDLTKRALSNIRALYMAEHRVENRIRTYYKIDLDTWFENTRYYIHNKNLLKDITPLLVSYIKSNKGLSTDDYFEIVEKVIEEFLKSIEYTSINYDIEYKVLKSIKDSEKITIITDGREDTFTNKTISPIRITINKDNSRTIEYYDYNKTKDRRNITKIREINLSDIYAINDKDIPARDFLMKFATTKQLKILNDLKESVLIQNNFMKTEVLSNLKTKIIEDKEQIILECNTNLLEYFLYKPLENQRIYSTKEQILEFEEVYKYKSKDNKFYVVGIDKVINASSSVLKCLGEVKVLTPTSLNDFVSEKIQEHNSLS